MLMNGAEERGPPCDRNKAFCGSVRVLNNRAKLLASTLRAALDCQPALGWFGSSSSSRDAETSPVAKSSQLGHTKPSASTLRWLIPMACTLGASCSVWMARMMVPAISGCRSAIIWMASAQLAQCAACLNLTALLRPSPPMAKGRLALAEQAMAPGSTPTNAQKHLQICVSCWVANAWDKLGLTVRM